MNYAKFFTGEIFSIWGGVSYHSVGLNAAGGEFDAKTRVICVNDINRNAICVKENWRITLKRNNTPIRFVS